MKIKLGSCITVIFDLEFYVPEKSRKEVGFCYNPWDKKSKILGGSFLSINGFTVDKVHDKAISKKIRSYWLWEHENNERALLETILDVLVEVSEKVSKAHNGTRSAVLCGIGISSSDVPILFISVLEKQRLLKGLELAIDVFKNRDQRISTSKLNDTILPFIQKVPPPAIKGKYIKIKYCTQLPTPTPTFAFFARSFDSM